MRTLILAVCAFLEACAGNPTLPTVVKVPVAVPCLSEAVKSPTFISDAGLVALPDYDFVVSLAKDRTERKQYEVKLEAAIAGCM
jgi:hypothetical protein